MTRFVSLDMLRAGIRIDCEFRSVWSETRDLTAFCKWRIYSPFVAAHFAFDALYRHRDSPSDPEPARSAVWALNTSWLRDKLRRVLSDDDWALSEDKKNPASFRQLYVERSPPMKFVSTATPMRLNERLSIQQGLFLCPGDVATPWIENLASLGPLDDPSHCRAIIMDRAAMAEAFADLRRMNVTARSLLPGLDGYAQSMGHSLKMLLEWPISDE